MGSNHRPLACKASALPLSYAPVAQTLGQPRPSVPLPCASRAVPPQAEAGTAGATGPAAKRAIPVRSPARRGTERVAPAPLALGDRRALAHSSGDCGPHPTRLAAGAWSAPQRPDRDWSAAGIRTTRPLSIARSTRCVTAPGVTRHRVLPRRDDQPAARQADRPDRQRAAGSVADIAGTVLFLAPPAANHISGQTIHVNGGAL